MQLVQLHQETLKLKCDELKLEHETEMKEVRLQHEAEIKTLRKQYGTEIDILKQSVAQLEETCGLSSKVETGT